MLRFGAVLVCVALAFACGDRARDAGACVDGDSMPGADLCNSCICYDGEWSSNESACGFSQVLGEDTRCWPLGLGDVEPDREGVQLLCNVVAETETPFDETSVPACVTTDDGYTWPAADADMCWFARTDKTHTGATFDDVSAGCVEARGDLIAAEFELLRRPDSAGDPDNLLIVCLPPEPQCPGWPADSST